MRKTRHKFQSAKADGGDATLIRPSSWNAEHDAGEELTNRTGGALAQGDVVALSDLNNESVILGDTQDSMQPYVVALGSIADGVVGLFAQFGGCVASVSGAVVRGNWLAKSSSIKALYDTGVPAASGLAPIGALAIAMTGSAGPGTVNALLIGSTVQAASTRKGLDIASGSSITIPAGVHYVHITGTTTITGIASRPAGTLVVLTFDGALQITHNGSSMVMANGRTYQTTTGDTLLFVSEGGGNWRQIIPITAQVAQVLASSHVAIGSTPAQSGAIRLGNDVYVTGRKADNTGDINIAKLDSSNRPMLGPGDATNIRMGGQVRCDLDATSRAVAPVGTDKWAI